MKRFPTRCWTIVTQGFMALGMSGAVSLLVTCVNTGVDAGLLQRWLGAWGFAFPIAWGAALVWRPVAFLLARLICDEA